MAKPEKRPARTKGGGQTPTAVAAPKDRRPRRTAARAGAGGMKGATCSCGAARALGQMAKRLAGVSHELRTPLNAVLGYTELLLDGVAGELNPEQRKRLERALANGREVRSLVDGLPTALGLEAGLETTGPDE